MKKVSSKKLGLLLQVTFVTAVLLFASCGNNQKPKDTKEVAEDQNDEKFDQNKKEKDAQFLVNAAEINMEEIQLGQLAQQRGTANHVKEMGKMMEDAHTKSLNDLTALAQTKTITIPTSATDDAKDAYEKLSKKSGNDFDREYTDMMVNKHKDAIDAFEKVSTDEDRDAEIKNWAIASLPNLRTHYNHAVEVQKKTNSNK